MGKIRRTRIESISTRPRLPTHLAGFDVAEGRRGATTSQRAMMIRIPKKNPNLMNNSPFCAKGFMS
jgi:hypothetical protein